MPRVMRWSVPVLLAILLVPGAVGARGLVFLEAHFDGQAPITRMDGARGVAVSPDLRHAYVAAAGDDAVTAFCMFCPGPFFLNYVEEERDGFGGVDGLEGAHGIAVSPDGKHVYVASELDDAVAAFSRDSTTGALTFVEAEFDGVGGVDGLNGAYAVVVSPDGKHVYVSGRADSAVAVFSRDGTTGALTFVEVDRHLTLSSPRGLALSAGGEHLYVAAGQGLTVFVRDAMSGALSFVETEQDGVAGVEGVAGARAVAVPADGAHVYVVSSDQLLTFARAAGTGMLTFVAQQAPPPGVTVGGEAVIVTPDGGTLYVARGSGVLVFGRDVSSGLLSFADRHRNGAGGTVGVSTARALAALDSYGLLVVGEDFIIDTTQRGAIVLLSPDVCGTNVVTGDEQCDDGNAVDGDGCSAACRLETCTPAPAAGCRQPTEARASTLSVVRGVVEPRDSLSWRWRKGEPADPSVLGTPLTTTGYAVCVYDGSGSPQPLLAMAAPRDGSCDGPDCWSTVSGGIRYRDPLTTPDGISNFALRAGTAGHGSATVKARGSLIGLPALPLTAPVTIQVRRTDAPGECWEATFSTGITVNDATRFKAKND